MSADRHDSPFGTILTAMVSPMFPDGEVDYEGAARLASHLVDIGNDGIVVNGTTGEAPTTTDQEKDGLLRAVLEAVGDRAVVVAGAGTNDTRHSIELARQAEAAGAHGLLAVTPYYSKPPQTGIAAHFTAIADAVGLPVMLYDIPGRAGTAIDWQTLVFLAEHPRIAAVKDAKGNLESVVEVTRRTDLQWYSGDDGLNLPFLSIGAAGVVSVTGHLVAGRLREMAELFWAGDVAAATAVNQALQPITTGLFRTQGAILVKAALNELGQPAGPMRLPLIYATAEQLAVLRVDLAAGGIDGFTGPGAAAALGDTATPGDIA
ncbi:MAG: 4-hydroxy-tetrahydrodipicolinate synthase [Candidatus Nanopelagicales bacterium]